MSDLILAGGPPIVVTVMAILGSVYYFRRNRQDQEDEAHRISYLANSISRALDDTDPPTESR